MKKLPEFTEIGISWGLEFLADIICAYFFWSFIVQFPDAVFFIPLGTFRFFFFFNEHT